MQVCHFQHLLRQLDKNEPSRFLGDGVSFRAKLIGVLEVAEARGDRMCQEALADLKMAVRAAGEHKQRIQVHVAIDGLRLRDDKTGDSLYHHPVHKISFIAQDMTDSRAFGYIFGSPDTGHRFFGIKTDKAASQVVIAMRDLFQVVFELKKKEIELAKQQLEGKARLTPAAAAAAALAAGETYRGKYAAQAEAAQKTAEAAAAAAAAAAARGGDAVGGPAGGVAELVDLEQELCSLRRGLTQVEGLTPSSTQPDPFGDTFTPPASAHLESKKGLLPPPPGGTASRSRSATSAAAATAAPRAPHTFSPARAAAASALGFELSGVTSQRSLDVTNSAPASFTDKNGGDPVAVLHSTNPSSSLAFDVFTELDPLGTGRSKPYVDKKHFFQELKNPPKKVLKDLVPINPGDILSVNESILTETTYSATTITSVGRHSGGSVSIVNPPPTFPSAPFASDPFAGADPFDSADPFAERFKEDPFGSRMDEFRRRLSREAEEAEERPPHEARRGVFNGPLQVSLPPEPAPKSPRMQRQLNAEARQSAVRQRPAAAGAGAEGASPPPPLPPKKLEAAGGGAAGAGRPPPRPPHSDAEHADSGAESGPAVPRPARRREPYPDRSMKPRLSSVTTNSSEDEYLSPVPPPLPGGARARARPVAALAAAVPPLGSTTAASSAGLDMTLSQLLTCGLDELAVRLAVPASRLATMTLQQLTAYLKDYLTRGSVENAATEPVKLKEKEKVTENQSNKTRVEFCTSFEDSFTGITGTNCTFVANFEDFDKKVDPSFDRYAVFREIQEEELKTKSLLDPVTDDTEQVTEDLAETSETKEEEELVGFNESLNENEQRNVSKTIENRSPMKALDELTIDSLSALYATSISPKPKEIDSKIEDIKSVMKNLSLHSELPRRSITPKENNFDTKREDKASDRYAALREITIVEPQDEYESLPPEAPKERKKSDEKSDGFDNSDFFDCIDNSSLSFSHVDDAFRRSPIVKEAPEKEAGKVAAKTLKVEQKGVRLSPSAPSPAGGTRLSAGSLSDIVSGSSPEAGIKDKPSRWSVLPRSPRSEEGASPWSSDSKESEARDKWAAAPAAPPDVPRPRRRPHATNWHARHTSSSSRDVSPWEEEPPARAPPPRPASHTHAHARHSRQNSSGSRECADSGSGREKEKLREKREAAGARGEREVSRDRRDVSKDRDLGRDRRDRRSRERGQESWERDSVRAGREYSREREYREPRGRERDRDKERDRHRRQHHSWDDDDDDYSDGDGSNVSTPGHERWPDHRGWRRDDRNYGSLGWRQPRRRTDSRQGEDTADRECRYNQTLSAPARRSAREGERRRTARREPPPPRSRRDHRYRFDDELSERDSPRERGSPFENDFVETPSSAGPRRKGTYATLAFEDETTASPASAGSRTREPDAAGTRFRFDSDSLSPRSLFEDDFAAAGPARPPTASIAEEDETGGGEAAPRGGGARVRGRPEPRRSHRDIHKSESVNIFVRDTDPFDGDDFFACTGSDRAGRRENWPGDFQAFDGV